MGIAGPAADSTERENPQHDHRQRIRYARTGDGSAATIEPFDGTRLAAFVLRVKA